MLYSFPPFLTKRYLGGLALKLGFFIYLTPSVPLSFEGEGEEKGRGAITPLLDTPNKRTLDKSRLAT